MTDLQLIICAAVVAFSVSAVFGIGVIFSVREMLKSIDEEPPTKEPTTKELGMVPERDKYEYDIYIISSLGDARSIMNAKAEQGWRAISISDTKEDWYRILIERRKDHEQK